MLLVILFASRALAGVDAGTVRPRRNLAVVCTNYASSPDSTCIDTAKPHDLVVYCADCDCTIYDECEPETPPPTPRPTTLPPTGCVDTPRWADAYSYTCDYYSQAHDSRGEVWPATLAVTPENEATYVAERDFFRH